MSSFLKKKQVLIILLAFCFLEFTVLYALCKFRLLSTNDQKHCSFCCAVNCMDGRTQDVVKDYMRKSYSVDYVDMITEAGPNKVLATNSKSGLAKDIVIDIKERIVISQKHHGAKVVAIVGHFGCAGNPTNKKEQIQHLKKAKETVEGFDLNIKVILLWIEEDFKTIELIK